MSEKTKEKKDVTGDEWFSIQDQRLIKRVKDLTNAYRQVTQQLEYLTIQKRKIEGALDELKALQSGYPQYDEKKEN